MRSNYWGKTYGITTFGESHSRAVGVVIEDVKPNIFFPLQTIQEALDKRRPGISDFSSSRNEQDRIEILSGVFEGKTTGMPICLIVYNNDARSEDYEILKELFRPEHADLAYFKKYKIFDYRGGGRASGRETIARVAASSVLSEIVKDIKITLYPISIGNIHAQQINTDFISNNPLYWPCPQTYKEVIEYLAEIKEEKDSVGGIVEAVITNLPGGLGDPVFEKLDANIAKAVLSIGGVKGIEFGLGFRLAIIRGSEANQPINSIEPITDIKNAGGIYGGISTGEPIIFRFVVKPTPSIGIPQKTVNRKGEQSSITMNGRFDTCIVPRIIPVTEAMIKLVLADAVSYQKLITGEEQGLAEYREAIDKLDEDILISLSKRKIITGKISEIKKIHNIDAYQPEREESLLSSLMKKAVSLNLEPELIKSLWHKLFEGNRGKQ